jgi:hypothetical protein
MLKRQRFVSQSLIEGCALRFCTHGMQHNKVAGIHIPLRKDNVVPTMLKMLILSRS